MDILGSVVNNTGNIEKAIIEIMDLREREVIEKDAIKVVGGQGHGGDAFSYAQSAGGSMTNSGVLTDAVRKMAGFGEEETVNDVMLQSIATQNWKRYKVMFNPNTLHLSGHSGGLVQKSDFGKGNNGLQYSRGSTTIMMSVQLLFDACDPQDAFMGDKLSSSPTATITGVAKGFLSAGVKKITVQPEVEGFIGAIRNPCTRIITFNWGDLSYSGSLRNVRAQYSMFNMTGDPVRATVDLSIMCADDDELSGASLAVWQARYKDAFENGSESFAYTSGDAKSFMDQGKDWLGGKVGSLLNL